MPIHIPIIVDTREKRPWAFDPRVFDVKRGTLRTGDYALGEGLEDVVACERKSLGDLVNTLISDWIRFRKCLYRMAGFDCAAIAAECDLSDILNHKYESDANPESVIARCNECYIDHGVPVYFWGSATQAEKMAARFFGLCWKRFKD